MTRTLITIALVAACGGKDAPAVTITQADVDAVNALVPADKKEKFTFEITKIEDKMGRKTTTYTVAAPKGWKKGFLPGSLEPDEKQIGSVFGKTEMKVGDNCDGACKSKDWAAVVDKVYYSQYTGGKVKGKVVKDDKQKTSRTMVFEDQPTVEQQGNTEVTTGSEGIAIITTWWTDGGSRHFVCSAELAKNDVGLAAAFEKACSKVSVSGE